MKMHTAIAMEPLCLQAVHKVFKVSYLIVVLLIVESLDLKEIKKRIMTTTMKILP